MSESKLPQPVAVCTKCGTPTRHVEKINQQCHLKISGKRCTGVFRSALRGNADWKECSACLATGKVGSENANSVMDSDGFILDLRSRF